MSLTAGITKQHYVASESISNTPEQALLIALLEDCVRTITSKGSLEEAKSDIEWLHGLTDSGGGLTSDDIADYLDSDIVAILREKYPLGYVGDYVPVKKVTFTFEMEEKLLNLYRKGASVEAICAEFPDIRKDILLRKARVLMIGESFTPDDDAKLVDYYVNKGYPVYKLVKMFRKNERAITRRLIKLGQDLRYGKFFSREEKEVVREGVRLGWSSYKIAKKLNRAITSVDRQIVLLRLKKTVVNNKKA